MNRSAHRFVPKHVWIWAVLLIVLLAGHGLILYYVSSHLKLWAVALVGVVILLVIKHVGLLGPVYALFRRWRSGSRPE
jgi:membrane protein YdbS with pleckstrin-like domain